VDDVEVEEVEAEAEEGEDTVEEAIEDKVEEGEEAVVDVDVATEETEEGSNKRLKCFADMLKIRQIGGLL
jgi:hypothetical protein